LQSCAHKLRGASESLGIDAVSEACTGLEAALRAGAPAEPPTLHLVDVLDTALRELRLVIGHGRR
jgi:HPt (histidine-containing phosphotransfer) domain-containing protein